MALLVTPTLLNSFDWYNKVNGQAKVKARHDIFNTLSRIYADEQPIHMRKGIEFENQVYKWANRDRRGKGSKLFNEVCDIVQGGYYQKKSKKNIMIDSVEYCVYSKLDVRMFKPKAKIIDIKTTANYKGPESYLSGWQHKWYCFTEEVFDFEYLIIEWGLSYEIDSIHRVNYHAPGLPELKIDIMKGVQTFIRFLKNNDDLWDAYYNKYCLYK